MGARKVCLQRVSTLGIEAQPGVQMCGRGFSYASPCLAEAMCFVAPGVKAVVSGGVGAGSVEETEWVATSASANCAGGAGDRPSLKFLEWAREGLGAAAAGTMSFDEFGAPLDNSQTGGEE